MNKKDVSTESLQSISTTISNYDAKANALLSAVGIVFGFSMFSIQELLNKTGDIQKAVYIVGIMYLAIFVFAMSLLSLIIFPRGRNKKEEKNKNEYPMYSEDLYRHIKNEDLEMFMSNGIKPEAIMDQIKVCARIAHIKETLLKIATIVIIVFALLLTILVVLLFV